MNSFTNYFRHCLSVTNIPRLWRGLLPVLLVWMFFEGVFKKKLGDAETLIIIKDILVICIYLSFISYSLKYNSLKFPKSSFFLMFVIYMIYVLLNSIPSLFSNKFIFFVGFRSQIFYAFLFFISYNFFISLNHIDKYIEVALIISIFLVIYALYQLSYCKFGYFDDPFLADGGYDIRARSFGLKDTYLIMPTSVFSGFGRFARYCGLVITLGISILLRYKSQKRVYIQYVALSIAFIGVLISGRRTALLAILITYIIFSAPLLISLLNRFNNYFIKLSLKRLIGYSFFGLIFLLLLINSTFLTKTIKSSALFFQTTVEKSDKNIGRLSKQINAINFALEKGGLLGSGTGTKSLGSSRYSYHEKNPFGEAGFAKIIWEQGIVGFLLWILLFLSIFLDGLILFLNLKTFQAQSILIGCLAYVVFFIIYTFKAFQFYDDSYQQIYLWIILGAMFSLRRLEPTRIA